MKLTALTRHGSRDSSGKQSATVTRKVYAVDKLSRRTLLMLAASIFAVTLALASNTALRADGHTCSKYAQGVHLVCHTTVGYSESSTLFWGLARTGSSEPIAWLRAHAYALQTCMSYFPSIVSYGPEIFTYNATLAEGPVTGQYAEPVCLPGASLLIWGIHHDWSINGWRNTTACTPHPNAWPEQHSTC
jgi:hypothetical protein